jgi:DNA-binding GntR family transcriptional regulator
VADDQRRRPAPGYQIAIVAARTAGVWYTNDLMSMGSRGALSTMSLQLVVKPIDQDFSLKGHIYDVLKQGITSMNIYADGAELRLDERQLSEQLKISRTPIREALARLEQEGLVRIAPRKGVFILRKSVGEILEMIIAWAALESMAARVATERASTAEIGSLRSLLASFDQAEIRYHIDEYSDANITFHRRILAMSQCKILTDMADGLFIHMRAIRARTMTEGDRATRSIVDHTHIVEALEARDADLAERLVREHTLRLHDHVKQTWVETEPLQMPEI